MDKINQLLDGSQIIKEAYDTSTQKFEKYREKVYSWCLLNDTKELLNKIEQSESNIGFRIALKLAQSTGILSTKMRRRSE